MLSEQSIDAPAAYGDLVVHGSWVGLCINSGQAVDEEPPVVANIRSRIDYWDNADLSRFKTDVVADEIWLWNTADNATKHVKIPQIAYASMIVCNKFIGIFVLIRTFQHSARFQFVGDRLVLAGSVEDGSRAAIIGFPFSDSEPIAFAEPQLSNPECVERSVAAEGNIVVHCHESGCRITVFKSGLISGAIPVRDLFLLSVLSSSGFRALLPLMTPRALGRASATPIMHAASPFRLLAP